MARKSPNPNPNQGMLIDTAVVGNGQNTPETFEANPVHNAVEGGFYSGEVQKPTVEYDFSDPAILESVHKAVQTERNSKAQRGLHSALDPKTGLYDVSKVAPGIVLPDYGIVKYGNLDEARKLAEELNERIRTGRSRPL